MAKRFELIVFDWDGTLMDSAGAIVAAIQSAARDLGLAPPSEEAARHIIGLGLQDALRYVLPGLEPARYGEMSARYRHHYLAWDSTLTLFAGAEEMIRELHGAGFLLGVATGKSRHGLNRALELGGLGRYFHDTRCADECFSKPHPQMLEQLMEKFGIEKAATLMIGDTTHDLQMARNAGVAGIAVSYGAHPKAMLVAEAPLHCVDSLVELSSWLRANA